MKKGYMKDDYVHLFVKKQLRRAPIINRGIVTLFWLFNYGGDVLSVY